MSCLVLARPATAATAVATRTLQWTLCIVCLSLLLLACQANPISSTRKHDPAATLVVTNDGTFHTTSSPNRSRSSTTSPKSNNNNNNNNARQAKQRKLPIDLNVLGFREEASDYPEDEIRRLLNKTPEAVKDLFNVVNTQLDPHMNLTERTAFYNDNEELGGGVREESVCRTVTRNIYPREATRQNSLVYIPNNQEFMQVIQAEICQHPDSECGYLRDALPYGMTSVCYQKYAYKKLLYFEATDKRMASDLFRYPSCCACYVRSLPFDLRSAANATLTTSPSSLVKLPENPNEAGGDNNQPSSGSGRLSSEASFATTASTTPESDNLAGRSLESQASRTSRKLKASNQTVILNSSKVFEANK